MIHELHSTTLIPGKQAEYLKLAAEVGRPARGDRYGVLRGHWYSEFGTLNHIVQLWSFADLGERERLRSELAKDEGWTQDYLARIRPLTAHQERRILRPIVELTPPAGPRHVYELREYRTLPGRAAEWMSLFEAVLPTREKYMQRVGVWQTEIGPLHEVVHLWAFADLNERAAQRARLGQDPDWQRFLAASLPLLHQMQSVILLPSPHSPMP